MDGTGKILCNTKMRGDVNAVVSGAGPDRPPLDSGVNKLSCSEVCSGKGFLFECPPVSLAKIFLFKSLYNPATESGFCCTFFGIRDAHLPFGTGGVLVTNAEVLGTQTDVDDSDGGCSADFKSRHFNLTAMSFFKWG